MTIKTEAGQTIELKEKIDHFGFGLVEKIDDVGFELIFHTDGTYTVLDLTMAEVRL